MFSIEVKIQMLRKYCQLLIVIAGALPRTAKLTLGAMLFQRWAESGARALLEPAWLSRSVSWFVFTCRVHGVRTHTWISLLSGQCSILAYPTGIHFVHQNLQKQNWVCCLLVSPSSPTTLMPGLASCGRIDGSNVLDEHLLSRYGTSDQAWD